MRSLTKQSAALAAAIGVTAMAADAPAATATAHSPPPSSRSTCVKRLGTSSMRVTFPGRRDQRLIRAVATRPRSGPDVGNAAASLLLPGVSGVVAVRGSGEVLPVLVDLDPGPPGLAAELVGVAACEES
jgi:hypothetical protein